MYTTKKTFAIKNLFALSLVLPCGTHAAHRRLPALFGAIAMRSLSCPSVDYSIAPAPIADVQKNMPAIIKLSREAFLKNHEITAYYYQQTDDELKPEFEQLFDDHIIDMIQEIDRHRGIIFLVKDSHGSVIGISVGRPYGCSALSHDFMNRVFASKTHFKEVMKGWWNLMEKYQATPQDCPDHVYHQALTAIAPEKAGQGVGTQLSKVVMKEITQLGFKALVRETSSAGAHKVAANLHDVCHVVTIDEQMNEATKISLVLRVQFTDKNEETAKILAWFEGKKAAASIDLRRGGN